MPACPAAARSRSRVPASAPHPARLCVLAAALAGGACAFAQQPDGDGPGSGSSWSLGLGVMSVQKPYAGIDRESKVLPLLRFENEYLEIFGPQIGVKLPSLALGESQRLEFSLVGKYDGSGYKADDAPILSGMSRRKGGFWAGAKVEWKNDVADLSAEWLADASGHSKGQQFSLGLERTWHFGRHLMLTPRVAATWQDRKYVDYYFGVRDSEVAPGRPAYAGKSGTGAEVGLRAVYLFDRQHSVFVDAAVSSLPKAAKDSPLVDRSNDNRVLLGYTYRF
jgi:outer membrane protein